MPVKHQRLYHILIKIGLPLKSMLRNDRLQYVPDLPTDYLNVRVGVRTSNPTELLRYFFGNVRKPT